jgi:RNA polymerase sigma-70 factor, ECF subfamily
MGIAAILDANMIESGKHSVAKATPLPVKSNGLNSKTFLDLIAKDRHAAFELLVETYRTEIFDLCFRIGGNRTEAEDLTQETFISVYEKLDGYRGDAAPRSWLYRIAINKSITFTRRLKRWRMQRGKDDEIFPELPELNVSSDEKLILEKDLAIHAHKALQDLSARQRTAVILRVIQEMPYEQVATAMNISVGGAKANVHNGIKKLRETLRRLS